MGKILEEDKPDQETVAETERNGKETDEPEAEMPSESGADSENAGDNDIIPDAEIDEARRQRDQHETADPGPDDGARQEPADHVPVDVSPAHRGAARVRVWR